MVEAGYFFPSPNIRSYCLLVQFIFKSRAEKDFLRLDYLYSSAKDYSGKKSPVNVSLIELHSLFWSCRLAPRRSLAQVINIYFVPTDICVTTPYYCSLQKSPSVSWGEVPGVVKQRGVCDINPIVLLALDYAERRRNRRVEVEVWFAA